MCICLLKCQNTHCQLPNKEDNLGIKCAYCRWLFWDLSGLVCYARLSSFHPDWLTVGIMRWSPGLGLVGANSSRDTWWPKLHRLQIPISDQHLMPCILQYPLPGRNITRGKFVFCQTFPSTYFTVTSLALRSHGIVRVCWCNHALYRIYRLLSNISRTLVGN